MQYKNSVEQRYSVCLTQINELIAVYNHLQNFPSVAENILRAILVMIVSAIDTTIHEIVVNAVLFELAEKNNTFKIDKVKFSSSVITEIDEIRRMQIIETDVRLNFSKSTFQSPSQIEKALNSVGFNGFWQDISLVVLKKPESIKKQLDLLVNRRNKIVHEGDINYLHQKNEISFSDIQESLDFVRSILDTILKKYFEMLTM